MTKLKTTIGLDYDGTITRDPDMWHEVMQVMQRHGHQVHIVTMRYDTESRMGGEPMQERFLTGADGVHFTGNHETEDRDAKKPHMDAKGIEVHVWIDDNPMAVHKTANEIWGWNAPAGNVIVAGSADFDEQVKKARAAGARAVDVVPVEPVAPKYRIGAPPRDNPLPEGWLDDYITSGETKLTKYEMPGVYFVQGVRFAEAHYASRLAASVASRAGSEPVAWPIPWITGTRGSPDLYSKHQVRTMLAAVAPAAAAEPHAGLIAELREAQSRTNFSPFASPASRTLFDRVIAALGADEPCCGWPGNGCPCQVAHESAASTPPQCKPPVDK